MTEPIRLGETVLAMPAPGRMQRGLIQRIYFSVGAVILVVTCVALAVMAKRLAQGVGWGLWGVFFALGSAHLAWREEWFGRRRREVRIEAGALRLLHPALPGGELRVPRQQIRAIEINPRVVEGEGGRVGLRMIARMLVRRTGGPGDPGSRVATVYLSESEPPNLAILLRYRLETPSLPSTLLSLAWSFLPRAWRIMATLEDPEAATRVLAPWQVVRPITDEDLRDCQPTPDDRRVGHRGARVVLSLLLLGGVVVTALWMLRTLSG